MKPSPTMAIWCADTALVQLGREYLEWLQVKNYATSTIVNRRYYLGFFLHWCRSLLLDTPHAVTRHSIEKYQSYLYSLHSARLKACLTPNSRRRHLEIVRLFFHWLGHKRHLLYDPTAGLNIPARPDHLPGSILTQSEAERIINQPDSGKPFGIRDRALLETLYSTGIRRRELARLTLDDLDIQRGILMVVEGKGGADRVVPIGDRALRWIEKYLAAVRPRLGKDRDERALFLTKYGRPFQVDTLTVLVRNYIKAADIGKPGSCHIFRHTAATLMLENGAELRYIQEMLGHQQLSTTQLYTRVEIDNLKQVHRRTHPAEQGEA